MWHKSILFLLSLQLTSRNHKISNNQLYNFFFNIGDKKQSNVYFKNSSITKWWKFTQISYHLFTCFHNTKEKNKREKLRVTFANKGGVLLSSLILQCRRSLLHVIKWREDTGWKKIRIERGHVICLKHVICFPCIYFCIKYSFKEFDNWLETFY